MFGEDLIIGQSEGSIDEKGRIFIPKYCKPDTKDRIIIKKVNFKNEFALKLFAYKEFLNIINRLKKLRDNATTYAEYQKYNEEIEQICISLNNLVQLDSQKRLLIPKTVIDELGWNKKDLLTFNGLGESLLIRRKQKK